MYLAQARKNYRAQSDETKTMLADKTEFCMGPRLVPFFIF